jgi:hypothetical protein
VDYFAKDRFTVLYARNLQVREEVRVLVLAIPSFEKVAAFPSHELFVSLEEVVDLISDLRNEESVLRTCFSD